MEWILGGIALTVAVAVSILAGHAVYSYRTLKSIFDTAVAKERQLVEYRVAIEGLERANQDWQDQFRQLELRSGKLEAELKRTEKERDHLIEKLATIDPSATADAIRARLRDLQDLEKVPDVPTAPAGGPDPHPGGGAPPVHGSPAGRTPPR